MREIRKFTPDKVHAALKLLLALPAKDNRLTVSEALMMMERGIHAALNKGYDRTEIREKIATAAVVISATTMNDFLSGKLKNAISESSEAPSQNRKIGNVKTLNVSEANVEGIGDKPVNVEFENEEAHGGKRRIEEGKTQNSAVTNDKPMHRKTGTSPGSFTVKPDTPLEEL